jgi:hypothetical protein
LHRDSSLFYHFLPRRYMREQVAAACPSSYLVNSHNCPGTSSREWEQQENPELVTKQVALEREGDLYS